MSVLTAAFASPTILLPLSPPSSITTTTNLSPSHLIPFHNHNRRHRRRRRPSAPQFRVSASAAQPSSSSDGGRSSEFDSSSLSSSSSTPSIDWQNLNKDTSSSPHRFPALPFPPEEVFLPGETKQLHLFEARYISLFEACISSYDSHCGHILIDAPRRTMAAVGTLVHIRQWKRQAVGVSVTVDAIGRLHTTKLYPSAPYLTADFTSVEDVCVATSNNDDDDEDKSNGKDDGEEVKDLNDLCHTFWTELQGVCALAKQVDEPVFRRKKNRHEEVVIMTDGQGDGGGDGEEDGTGNVSGNDGGELLGFEQVQEMIKEKASTAVGFKKIQWDALPGDEDVEMVRRRAVGVSFAAWEVIPSSAQQRQKALETRSTRTRLASVCEAVAERQRELRAKAALKSALSS